MTRVVSGPGFGMGVYALLASLGFSGWIRSRKVGIATSIIASMGLIIVSWALAGFS